jgi:hypothetical protein
MAPDTRFSFTTVARPLSALPKTGDGFPLWQLLAVMGALLITMGFLTYRLRAGKPRAWGTSHTDPYGDAAALCRSLAFHFASSRTAGAQFRPLWTPSQRIFQNLYSNAVALLLL